MTSRILGIDWGEKRIGVAVSDSFRWTAQPLTTLEEKEEKNFEILASILRKYEIKTVVVGIPYRTDGKKGEKIEKVLAWIDKAKNRWPEVSFVEMDERFTTQIAKKRLQERGIREKEQKPRLDRISAAVILEQYLQMKKQ